MHPAQHQKNKLLVIFIATVLGAASIDGVGAGISIGYRVWTAKHSSGIVKDWLTSAGLILSLPSAVLTPENRPLANPYVVNGILGAIFFGATATAWQFIRRKLSKQIPDRL
jgi:hypothetical protein